MLRSQQIVLGLALLLALCAECLALSQRPSPTERKAGQPEQQQPQAPKESAATDQRGTEQSPLVVKVQPTPETETEAAANREEREQRSANEQETTKFNRFLVIIGALQLVVFVGQLSVFSYQAWKLRQTVGATENAADAAKKSADSLRNIERAYVFIDYELLKERNAAIKVGGISRCKQIELVLKNFGRTPAVVNGINCKCHYWPNRYLPETEPDSIKIPSGIAIGSGSPWSIPANFEGAVSDIDNAMNGAGSIYLYGTIMYLDMFGEQRETGFCCEWNFAEGQFFMAPNTKLNYYT
jgi:hypothetical protein